MEISDFEYSDLESLAELQPENWSNIGVYFRFYLENDFVKVIKYSVNGKMVGVGAVIMHKDTAWLAHIIVHKNYRSLGIGKKIVRYLLERVEAYETINLIATDEGYPLYKKFNFKDDIKYEFYKRENDIEFNISENIIDYNDKYFYEILEMDIKLSSENREKFLNKALIGAKLYLEDGRVKGYYLKNFGEGGILAEDKKAGLELLKLKMTEANKIILPSGNSVAKEFLLRHSYFKFKEVNRMFYGKEIKLRENGIYSRIGGNLG